MGRDALLVPVVELGDHLALEHLVELGGFGSIPFRVIIVLPTVPQGPPQLGRVGFRPPAIEL